MSALSANLDALFSKMENFVTTKTVCCDPVTVDGVTLLPLVEMSFGVGAGAYDAAHSEKKSEKGVGGGGVGAKITPVAVVVIRDGDAKIININSPSGLSKLIDIAPDVLSKIPAFFTDGKGKKDKEKNAGEDTT